MKNLVRSFAIPLLLCGFAWVPASLRGVATAQKRSDGSSRDSGKAKSKQEPELIAQAETTDYTAAVYRMKREKPEGVDVIDMRVTYKPYTEPLASIRNKLISGGMSASEAGTIVTVKYSGVDSEGKVTWVRARFYDKDGKGETSASLPAYSEPGAEGWQRTVNELFYTVMRVHRGKDLPQKPVEKQKPGDDPAFVFADDACALASSASIFREAVYDLRELGFWCNFSIAGRLSLFQLLLTRQALLPIPAGS